MEKMLSVKKIQFKTLSFAPSLLRLSFSINFLTEKLEKKTRDERRKSFPREQL